MSRKFELEYEPVDMVISVHMRNLFATYGEKTVREALKELFAIDMPSDEEVKAYLERNGGQ